MSYRQAGMGQDLVERTRYTKGGARPIGGMQAARALYPGPMTYRLPFGDDATLGPAPKQPLSAVAIAGWVAVVAIGAGVFWAVTAGKGLGRNPRRRSKAVSKRFCHGVTVQRWSRGKWAVLQDGVLVQTFSGELMADAYAHLQAKQHVRRNPLSVRGRARISAGKFVFPGRRAWPLDSAARAYDAIRALRMGRVKNASEYHAITQEIRRRYPSVWRKYGHALKWSHVKAAKARGISTRMRRRTRRGARRRVAANPSYKSRDPRGWGGDPKRGAAMGRHTYNEPGPGTFDKPLTLRKIPLDSGGYDPNGTYFGWGEPIYWLASDDGKIDRVFRARTRAEAKAKALALYPTARLYR